MKQVSRGECDLKDLIPAPYNPRKISDEQMSGLQKSLDRWGLVQEIVVNKRTNHIVGGHQRASALKVNGEKKAAVVWVDIDEDEERALNVALNSPHISGEFDFEKLPPLLDEIELKLPEVFDDLRFDLLVDGEKISATADRESDEAENAALDSIDGIKPDEVKPGERFEIGGATLICGDCVEVLSGMAENSVDAIVTDPPYGIGFMGKGWDCAVPGKEWADQCLRVLKPGGHIVSFAATRTVHRLGVVLEDSGFEIRDMISWLQWQGFPKSLDVSKAIDKSKGLLSHEGMGMLDESTGVMTLRPSIKPSEYEPPKPKSEEAKQWNGWGTALKPSQEPAILARKPLEGAVAENVLKWGAGGLNIDGCRIAYGDAAWPGPQEGDGGWGGGGRNLHEGGLSRVKGGARPSPGRWPANIYHCPKPSRGEREDGCGDLPAGAARSSMVSSNGQGDQRLDGKPFPVRSNFHPTVKPVRLMRWLVRLVTPPGGVVVDTFLGSGTTCVAAEKEGLKSIGIEFSPEYAGICKARITGAFNGEI
jgi:site-specific DNA-methyltransferase (adenine-specific)